MSADGPQTVPLTLFEIMVAKTYDETRDFDLSDKFDELIATLST
jgi:hypothetical protein